MTKTNTHTPGPWKAHDRLKSDTTPGYLITDETGTLGIARIILGNGEAIHANARLIAAAPALLEALEEAYKMLKGHVDPKSASMYRLNETLEQARGAK